MNKEFQHQSGTKAGTHNGYGFRPQSKRVFYVSNPIRDIAINVLFFVIVIVAMYGIIALMSL